MKILCTADIHIGQQAYGKIDPKTGLNTRTLHGLNVFDDMINYAINNNIEVFVFAGDMFKHNLPSPTIQDEVNKRIKKLSDNNIQTFILDGNHDVSKLNNAKSALKASDTFDIPNVIHDKFLNKYVYTSKDNKKYQFIMLPTYATKEEINDIVDNINYTLPTIFIGHLTIKGSLLNDWLVETKEEYIDKEIFFKNNVKAVILGHLHKYQILNEEPLIFYTGSPDRIDFGEENQQKGFTILEIDDKINYNFIENNAEKFYTLKLDINEIDDFNNYIINEININKNKINNSIVRLILNLNINQSINDKKIYETINQYNPKYILNIQKNYNAKKYNRNSNITSELSIEESLELYYKDKERKTERILLGKEIINDII